jgi:hypothetical protein
LLSSSIKKGGYLPDPEQNNMEKKTKPEKSCMAHDATCLSCEKYRQWSTSCMAAKITPKKYGNWQENL